jgi:sarcosine oxidase subunit alpha
VDRVFAGGLDHHALMTWNPLANRAAVALSRRLAGLGRLPATAARVPHRVIEERFDAVVIGAGPAGLAAAEALAAAGRRTLLVDEERSAGGRLRCALELPTDPPASWIAAACAAVAAAGGEVLLGAAAAGLWLGGGPLVAVVAPASPAAAAQRLRLLRARWVVLATGPHAQPAPISDGDLPGSLAARGLAAALAEHGVVAGERIAVLGMGQEANAVGRALARAGREVLRVGAARAARGSGRVAELVDDRGTRVACDAVAVAGPGLPAADLARAAGARLAYDARAGGFRLALDGQRVAPGIVAAGELLGPMSAAAAAESGRRAAAAALGDA